MKSEHIENKNLWGGRFEKEPNDLLSDFNSSISFDQRFYREDIMGSIVHASMLEKQKIISNSDLILIENGLNEILFDIQSGKLEIDKNAEDIHMFIESELTKRIGDAGKRLHTARSRNDQVANDSKVHLIDQANVISGLLADLINVVMTLAQEHSQTIMPGYTHLQRAQPITFGHHLMAYCQMFLRDLERMCDCLKRMRASCPLGSGALAGTTYDIDRFYCAAKLGFLSPSVNSIDSVSDRDYMIEMLSVFSIVMMHLSRFCEEIILWCSWEFRFIVLDDAFSTGSSIMPQKKNPDIAELVRGKTGRVYGDLITLLTMMKGLPLAYNKDMQEDKEAIFDGVDTVKACLLAFTPMLSTINVNKENMKKAAAGGFTNATDCADYLVKKGLPFRDSYTITGKLVAYCIKNEKSLEDLELSEFKAGSDKFSHDIYDAIKLENCVNRRKSYGSASTVNAQIESVKEKMQALIKGSEKID